MEPVSLPDRVVLDVGAGTRLAGRAVQAAGGRVLAVDLVAAMLAAAGTPGVVADAALLPVRTDAVGAVVAAFCFNHIDRPATGFREARRIAQRGGAVLAPSYGTEITHPVREAVDSALAAAGYRPPAWYEAVKSGPMAALSTPEGMTSAFVHGLPAPARHAVTTQALHALGTSPVLQRRMIALRATV